VGDIRCATCGEPWDADTVKFDLIHDTDLTNHRKREFNLRLNQEYRAAFKRIGWEFGPSILAIHRCECCPKQLDTNQEAAALGDAIADLAGDDLDFLQSELEDLDLDY